MLEQISKEVDGGFRLYEIDVDKNPETPMHYRIAAIPALLLFKGGKEVRRMGPTSRDAILKAIREIAGSPG